MSAFWTSLFLAFPLQAAPEKAPALSTSTHQVQINADPSFIDALRGLIQEDQRRVMKARQALKRARSKGKPDAIQRAHDAWMDAKAKLRADRESLRLSIEAREKELENKARRRR